MSDESIQMYFEITDPTAVADLDEALKPVNTFDEKLQTLQEKYGADKSYVFNSISRGLEFSSLWFKEFPKHLDTEKDFKVCTDKNKSGYEIRPRKTNKKFYDEFMQGLNDVDYGPLTQVLFGRTLMRQSMEYTRLDQAYYVMTHQKIVLAHKEITASEYRQAISPGE